MRARRGARLSHPPPRSRRPHPPGLAPVHGGPNGAEAGPEHPEAGDVPPAVHGEIVATLPLPRDVQVLDVVPAQLVIAIQRDEPEPSP